MHSLVFVCLLVSVFQPSYEPRLSFIEGALSHVYKTHCARITAELEEHKRPIHKVNRVAVATAVAVVE
jgi:hypothetical protein